MFCKLQKIYLKHDLELPLVLEHYRPLILSKLIVILADSLQFLPLSITRKFNSCHLHLINPNGAVSFDQFICYRILNIRKLEVPVISYTFKFLHIKSFKFVFHIFKMFPQPSSWHYFYHHHHHHHLPSYLRIYSKKEK